MKNQEKIIPTKAVSLEETKLIPTDGITVDEQTRTYRFPNNEIVTIENVFEIKVSPSGTHRLKSGASDETVKLHIIPTGWLHIEIDSPKQNWTF